MSGKINMLALDKSVLEFMRGPEGWAVASCDLNAVEPHILAHFSQCENYMKIYGPEANPNHDIYIYVGMAIPQYAELFKPHYDMDNPTKEGIAYIKDNYHQERQVCKTFHLAAAYGAMPPTIKSILEQQNVHIPLKEVDSMHRDYWRLFKVVKKYTQSLQAEWRRNGGYIITGRGTPKPLDHKAASKDILNRMIQTTAHQYFLRWLVHIENIRSETNTIARPLLLDLHDSTTWVCPEEELPKVDFMFQEGLKRLNEELRLTVVLGGKTKVDKSLGVIK